MLYYISCDCVRSWFGIKYCRDRCCYYFVHTQHIYNAYIRLCVCVPCVHFLIKHTCNVLQTGLSYLVTLLPSSFPFCLLLLIYLACLLLSFHTSSPSIPGYSYWHYVQVQVLYYWYLCVFERYCSVPSVPPCGQKSSIRLQLNCCISYFTVPAPFPSPFFPPHRCSCSVAIQRCDLSPLTSDLTSLHIYKLQTLFWCKSVHLSPSKNINTTPLFLLQFFPSWIKRFKSYFP